MSETVAFLAGLLGGLGVAFFEWYVSRPQRELERNFLSLQITQLSELVRDTAESVRHRLPGGEEYEFYRSSPSSDRDDFEGVPAPTGLRDGAQGIWSFEDGVLDFVRTNNSGSIDLRLQRYRFEAATGNVIHAGPTVTNRTLRVACEARTLEGHHTLAFVLKAVGDPGGVHLAPDQLIRVRENEWLYFERWLQFRSDKDCYVRVIDGSVSTSTAHLQVRNIVVSERLAQTS